MESAASLLQLRADFIEQHLIPQIQSTVSQANIVTVQFF
jgi:hypothetical protein